MYRSTINRTGATPFYTLQKRNTPTPALRARQQERGTHLLHPLPSAKLSVLLWKYTMGAYTKTYTCLLISPIYTFLPHRRGIPLSGKRGKAVVETADASVPVKDPPPLSLLSIHKFT